MRFVICYDTPSDRRRARVAKRLEACGFRVQFSVFECDLTAAMLRETARDVTALLDTAEDNVRIYPVCEACTRRIRVLGVADAYGLRNELFLF